MVLTRCLSPGSATIAHLTAGAFIGSGASRERVNVVEGQAATQRAFDAIFKPPEEPPEK